MVSPSRVSMKKNHSWSTNSRNVGGILLRSILWCVLVLATAMAVLLRTSSMNPFSYLSPSEFVLFSDSSRFAPGKDVVAQHHPDGWHSILVFYGDSDLLSTKTTAKNADKQQQHPWFAQARQDEIIAALYRNQTNLYFVDLAANNAVYLSNTLGLERNLQWRGLCIEANDKHWRGLSFRDCQVIAAVVGKERMEKVKFRLSRDELGGIVGQQFDNKGSAIKRRDANNTDTEYYTVGLGEILNVAGAPTIINYLSLDVEGAEFYVMQSFPWDKYQIQVLTIERPKPELQKLLIARGYRGLALLATFGETLWVHESMLEKLDVTALKHFQLPQRDPSMHYTVESTFIKGAFHTVM